MSDAQALRAPPASLLWLPTAVNAFILAETAQLWWERAYGTASTAQADLTIAMHVLVFSTPVAICFLIGGCVLAVLRRRVPLAPEETHNRGPAILALINLIAPFLHHLALRWAT